MPFAGLSARCEERLVRRTVHDVRIAFVLQRDECRALPALTFELLEQRVGDGVCTRGHVTGRWHVVERRVTSK